MYRIVCCTAGGDYIKITRGMSYLMYYKIPTAIRQEITYNLTFQEWDYLNFDTELSAKWFIGHRLTYNEKRKDDRKLNIMKRIFEYNNISWPVSTKLEFDVVEI